MWVQSVCRGDPIHDAPVLIWKCNWLGISLNWYLYIGRIGQWRHWIKVMINRTLTFTGWRLQKSDITPNMFYICYSSSWIFQCRSLLESGGHPRKISNFSTSNISHLNTWRQNAKAVGNIITVGQCFFSSLKKSGS